MVLSSKIKWLSKMSVKLWSLREGWGSAGSKTRGARSKLVGMEPPPPPINLLFHDFLTSPFRRFLCRVYVLNHFEPALSVCCPIWAYLVLYVFQQCFRFIFFFFLRFSFWGTGRLLTSVAIFVSRGSAHLKPSQQASCDTQMHTLLHHVLVRPITTTSCTLHYTACI